MNNEMPNFFKSKEAKKLLTLMGVLVVVGTFTIWLQFSHSPKKVEMDTESKKLVSIKGKRIKYVSLIDGKRFFKFECTDLDSKLCKVGDHSKWSLIEPSKMTADKSNVNALLNSLNNLKATEVFDLSEDTDEKKSELLEQYGLGEKTRTEAEFRRIEVITESSAKLVGYLGEEHPVGGKIFALREVDGKPELDRILLIPSHITSNFDKDLTHWRDKQLFNITASDIESFKFKNREMNISAARDGADWALTRGKSTLPGDVENVNSFLSAVANLKADDFTAEDKTSAKAKSKLRGTRSFLKLELALKQKPIEAEDGKESEAKAESITKKIEFFERIKDGKTEAVYARSSDSTPLYELSKGTKDRLNKKLKDFRMTRFITSLERYTFNKIIISNEPEFKSISYRKEGKEWVTDSADAPIPDSGKIQKLLDKLSGKRVKEFSSQIPREIKKITSGKSGLILRLSKTPEPGRAYAFLKLNDDVYAFNLNSKRKEVLKLDSVLKKHLPWKKDFFALATKIPVEPTKEPK